MKFMINGALTVGTLDGANVEMQRAVGNDNIYIFGLRADEVEEIWRRGYESIAYYNRSERLRRAVDALTTGFNGKQYTNIMHYLLLGHGVADPYMCLADFYSYTSTCRKAAADYENKPLWYKKVVMNIAAPVIFPPTAAFANMRRKSGAARAFTENKPLRSHYSTTEIG